MRRSRFLPGRPRIPPLPPFVVIEDRGDGTMWQISFAEFNGSNHVSITDAAVHPMEAKYVYKAFNEPFISGHPRVRLIIRDGVLGMEVLDAPVGISSQGSPPVHARRGFQREFIEIIIPKGIYWSADLHPLYGSEQSVTDND